MKSDSIFEKIRQIYTTLMTKKRCANRKTFIHRKDQKRIYMSYTPQKKEIYMSYIPQKKEYIHVLYTIKKEYVHV